MKSGWVFFFMCALFIGSSFSATHVFWYKALQNGYNLSENPGPNLNVSPENVHEGIISTQSTVGAEVNTFFLGTSASGWLANVAFFDLNYLKGTITSAKFRAEWADWRFYHLPGTITFRIGVDDVWGRPAPPEMDSIIACHAGQRGLTYYSFYFKSGAPLDTIQFTIPQGKSDTGQYPPPLAKQFFEFDVTRQVRYILDNNDSLQTKLLILRFDVLVRFMIYLKGLILISRTTGPKMAIQPT